MTIILNKALILLIFKKNSKYLKYKKNSHNFKFHFQLAIVEKLG